MAMNGLCFKGAEAMGKALKANRSLTFIDVSHNRIPEGGAQKIGDGLTSNDTLQILKVGVVQA